MMSNITNEQSPVLTVEEARLLLRLSRNSMYAAIAREEIPHLKIGRRILIPRKALERLMDGHHE
jgi:excisionase family DNA binding protein